MKSFKIMMILCVSLSVALPCLAYERIFYTLRSQSSDRMSSVNETLTQLKAHYQHIDMLIPQAYYTNREGILTGAGVEPDVLAFANTHHVKIMPLVTNYQFNGDVVHEFLSKPDLQANVIQALVALCQKNHFIGVQIDFEDIHIADRIALTQFFQAAATAMHKNGFLISFAVAPVATDQPESAFLKRLYDQWEGAYDLKSISQFADFVSVMAYNQHDTGTTPGSTANADWVNQVIQYTLKTVPRSKLSLGIPSYSTYWHTGADSNSPKSRIHVLMQALSYHDAHELIEQNKAGLQWDKIAKVHYALYTRHWLNEYIFLEDAQSFKAKMELVKKYRLRGISVFDLGTEDDGIWKHV